MVYRITLHPFSVQSRPLSVCLMSGQIGHEAMGRSWLL